MRIAIFTDSFFPELGGIQDSIAGLGRALAARGHHLLVIAPSAGEPLAEPPLGDRVTVLRPRSLPLPGSTGQSRLMLPWTRWQPARAAVEAFRPDLIHLHTFLTAGAAALAEGRRLGRPVVGTNHWAIDRFDMYGPPLLGPPLARQAGRWVSGFYRRCTLVTAPSADLLATMRAQGCDTEALVVSNPIDTDMFHPVCATERIRLRARFDLQGPVLLYAGRLAREKRIDRLIDALAIIANTCGTGTGLPACPTLLLAGQGSDHARLQARVDRRGLQAKVRFCGRLSPADLADRMRAADAFVTASPTETQCMALLQAMACGRPAVVANDRALPESLGPDAGLLADGDDPIELARAISTLMSDTGRRMACGEAARRRASRHSTAAVTDQWENLYAGLLA